MIHLESEINALLLANKSTTSVGKALSKAKNTLNASSHIVDAVNNFGDSLEENLDEVGGVAGSAAGWIAGKTTKLVGGIGAGIIAGTLKTVAGIIPDGSNPKQPETDLKIAALVDSYPLPTDKTQLMELLQWVHGHITSTKTPFGKSTLESLKSIHPRIFEAVKIVAENDERTLKLAKSYAPKKKFGFF